MHLEVSDHNTVKIKTSYTAVHFSVCLVSCRLYNTWVVIEVTQSPQSSLSAPLQ